MPRLKGPQPLDVVFKWFDGLPPMPPRPGTVPEIMGRLNSDRERWARIRGPYRSMGSARASAQHCNSRYKGYEFAARPDAEDGESRWFLFGRALKEQALKVSSGGSHSPMPAKAAAQGRGRS